MTVFFPPLIHPYYTYNTTVFAEDLIGLGFLWSFSYIKSIPTHEKLFAVGKKSGLNATFDLILLGVGLFLGCCELRRFHNNIYMISNPNTTLTGNTVTFGTLASISKRDYNEARPRERSDRGRFFVFRARKPLHNEAVFRL